MLTQSNFENIVVALIRTKRAHESVLERKRQPSLRKITLEASKDRTKLDAGSSLLLTRSVLET